jgi:hypothetical protein
MNQQISKSKENDLTLSEDHQKNASNDDFNKGLEFLSKLSLHYDNY